MNDKWIKELEDRLKGHTENGPEGLWGDIERELFKAEKGKVIPLWSDSAKAASQTPSRNRGVKRALTGVAVAAILLFGGMELYYWSTENQQIEDHVLDQLLKEDAIVNIGETEGDTDTVDPMENVGVVIEEKKSTIKSLVETNSKNQIVVSESEDDGNQSILKKDSIVKEEEQRKLVEEKSSKGSFDKEAVLEELESIVNIEEIALIEESENIEESIKHKSNRRLAVGLLSGNAGNASSMQQVGRLSAAEVFNMEDTKHNSFGLADVVLSEILVANQNTDIYTDVKHRRPVRFGVSLYYPLGDKWGFNTGVTYTKLNTDFTTGNKDYNVKTTQELYYVGVPLQVNYNLWNKKSFTAYLGGGVHFEKAVRGTLKSQYTAENIVENRPKENIKVKGLQTSVNLGIGLEYKISKNIGVYAEPGAQYHFANSSGVETIYTERPFDLNVQVGLRYSVPQRATKQQDLSE